jgi:hypothetical protein
MAALNAPGVGTHLLDLEPELLVHEVLYEVLCLASYVCALLDLALLHRRLAMHAPHAGRLDQTHAPRGRER